MAAAVSSSSAQLAASQPSHSTEPTVAASLINQPDVILQLIMRKLKGRHILRLARTCPRLLAAAQSPLVWRHVDVQVTLENIALHAPKLAAHCMLRHAHVHLRSPRISADSLSHSILADALFSALLSSSLQLNTIDIREGRPCGTPTGLRC